MHQKDFDFLLFPNYYLVTLFRKWRINSFLISGSKRLSSALASCKTLIKLTGHYCRLHLPITFVIIDLSFFFSASITAKTVYECGVVDEVWNPALSFFFWLWFPAYFEYGNVYLPLFVFILIVSRFCARVMSTLLIVFVNTLLSKLEVSFNVKMLWCIYGEKKWSKFGLNNMLNLHIHMLIRLAFSQHFSRNNSYILCGACFKVDFNYYAVKQFF